MIRAVVGVLLAAVVSGCASGPSLVEPSGNPVLVSHQNPMVVPGRDPQCVWETIADVVDDYFRIKQEEPARLVGQVVTEGRLETFPEVASTIFEPWRHDSADTYEKVESTLQSIRRRAQVRMVPGEGGFWIEVAVFKELEDVRQPAHASAGAATFRNDSSLTRVVSTVGEQEATAGWILMGRDPALEQRILAQLHERFGLGVPQVGPTVVGNRDVPKAR
jgi:hypothetical protein